jgi:carbamoyltransferase
MEQPKMKILGICDNHDSGAALCIGGKIVSAASEERFCSVKQTRRFPHQSIDYVLADNRLALKDIDVIALASSMTPLTIIRLFQGSYDRWLSGKHTPSSFSYLLNLQVLYQLASRKSLIGNKIEAFLSGNLIRQRLGFKGRLMVIDHHHAHAASAYYASGFPKALIITMDALGDGLSLTVSAGRGIEMKRIFSQSGLCSIGIYYSRITDYLGFRPNRHEGKVTGLSAYGDPARTKEIFHRMLHCSDGKFNDINYLMPHGRDSGIYRELRRFSREDIAAGLQKNLEEEVCKFVSFWMSRSHITDVVLSGGIFANVKLNQRIHEIKNRRVFIFPHMGDGGLAYGAALSVLKPTPRAIGTLYLGPGFSDEEVRSAIRRSKTKAEHIPDIDTAVAHLLAEGNLVARFKGRMEYGPRALGNRSILYKADDRSVNKWLNQRLKRTEFMPFAPSTLVEHAKRCYHNLGGAEEAARFMTMTFDCTAYMRKTSPAVVHVDGTARPQLVSAEDNPGYHRILSEYHRLTGMPTILNTSFNMHEEPIVCTPDDAIRAFRDSKLPYLAIENYLVKQDR